MKTEAMKLHILYLLLVFTITSFSAGCQQKQSPKVASAKHVGGACEGCEAIYESPVPFAQLNNVDTLPGFAESGAKLIVTGTVFQADGKTPAANVVVYAYHTNEEGIYPTRGNETGWGKRHGYLRGWVKTGADGRYSFYTYRPAAYPGRTDPAHIHFLIKEPDVNEYYIDDVLFNDDPLLTKQQRQRQQNRGGNGIVSLQQRDGSLIATRNIYLGKNIPGYPSESD